ncbi:MAG: T9SS type A sorting domain-containing protein [Bacteroidales bacterium]
MKNNFLILLTSLFLLVGPTGLQAQQMTVVKAAYFRKSPPLSEMAAVLAGPRDRTWKDSLVKNLAYEDRKKVEYQLTPPSMDPVRQSVNATLPNNGPVLNFDGVGNVNSVYPPDTDGDVGPNHYFQMINLSFAIYDKQGNKLFGPVNNSTLWAGFIGPWTGTNDGDPIVLYDELADRWMASQFAVNTSNGTYWELIAISETGDPLGSWYQYAFQFPAFNDYPKMAVWPDAYYASFNMFGSYLRVAAAAFEREAMISGNPNARMVLFDLPANSGPWSMLPSDFDGTPPPPGTPCYFAYFTDDGLGGNQDAMHFWEFHVDWNNLSNSSFQHAFSLPVAPFDAFFCNASRWACIPQPSGAALETLSDRLMYRLQYRNFGTYQSMVTCHSVDADGQGHAGVRWYEFRKTGNNPWEVYQQGTYAPDNLNRWMPSIAMNGAGDIAIGYSVSDESHHPSIRYTGRSATAPLGVMNYAEAEAITGLSSQGSYSRWGDYAMMSVDPADDTSFWLTTEYMKYAWKTRILKIHWGANPVLSASAGPDTLVCAVIPYNNVSASAHAFRKVEWQTSGDGYFIRANDTNSIYFPGAQDKLNGQVNLWMTAYGYNMVDELTDSITLTLSPSPSVNAGKDTTICAGDPAYLNGWAAHADSIVWSTNGDGIFSDINSLQTMYYPGNQDKSKGYVNLRLTGFPIAPCPASVYDIMRLNITVCTGTTPLSVAKPYLDISPNPASSLITLSAGNLSAAPVRLSVFDLQGNELFTKYLSDFRGETEQSLDVHLLPSGSYLITLEQGGTILKAKFIKQ